MKTRTLTASALCALLGISFATPATSAPRHNNGEMHPVDVVNIRGNKVRVGSTDAHVLNVLSTPAEIRFGARTGNLVETVWVYHDMQGRGTNGTSGDDCDTFLVTLVDTGQGRRVTDMKLVDERADRYYLAQINARAPRAYANR